MLRLDDRVSAEQLPQLRQGALDGATERRRVHGHQSQRETSQLVLDELVLEHLAVALEHLPDGARMNLPAIGQRQDVLHASLQFGEQPERASARTRFGRHHSEIANGIIQEHGGAVDEIADHDPSFCDADVAEVFVKVKAASLFAEEADFE